jgi:cytochrome b561
MNWKDSRTEYGVVSKINHWLGALLVILLLGIGIYFHEMPKGEERLFWMRLHVGLGLLAFLPLAFRIVWRWSARSPDPMPQHRTLQLATRAVHGVLLLGIAVLLLTGPFIVWSAGVAVDAFGLLSLPSPIGKVPALHSALEGVHAVVGKFLLPLIGVHLLAALKHAFFDRAGPSRMLGSAAET